MNYFSNLFFRLTNSIHSPFHIKSKLENNILYKNIHAGKRCFIIGNGSSLKKQDLSPLSTEITFVMNAFWKHPIISKIWQPTYCCFADPMYFDSSKKMKYFFKNLRKKIKNSTFFTSLSGKSIIETQQLLPTEQTNYVEFGSPKNDNEIDLTSIVSSVQSTSQLALEVAVYMGCNPIYLLGLDHDWLAHKGVDKHFYEAKSLENHPIAPADLSKISYKSELESMLRLWQIYEILKNIAEQKHIQILNATDGGFLDIFERKKYEEIFNDNKRKL